MGADLTTERGDSNITKIEVLQLQKLSDNFNAYVKEDMEWKKKFETEVNPLLEANRNNRVVKDWWRTAFHITATVVGFIVTVGLAIHYVVEPLITNFKK